MSKVKNFILGGAGAAAAAQHAVYELKEQSGMVHRIFIMYHGARSDQVQGILHSPSKMRAPHGPAGPGIYLSRDYKEAKRHGEVVLKVLAYTGRVKKLDRRTQQPLANIHADSFYYDKASGGGGITVTCLRSEQNLEILGVCGGFSKLDKSVQNSAKEVGKGKLEGAEEQRLKDMVRLLGLKAREDSERNPSYERGYSGSGSGGYGGYGYSGSGYSGGGYSGGGFTRLTPTPHGQHAPKAAVNFGDPLDNLKHGFSFTVPPSGQEVPKEYLPLDSRARNEIRDSSVRDAFYRCLMQRGGGGSNVGPTDLQLKEAFELLGGKDLVEKIRVMVTAAPDQVPLLRQGHTASVVLKQSEVSGLLASAAFCSLPRPPAAGQFRSSANFGDLYSADMPEKLKCLHAYFKERANQSAGASDNLISYSRKVLRPGEEPDWRSIGTPLIGGKFHVSSQGFIEDNIRMLQVDFANEYVGGGVLGRGSVQEELLFLKHPELMASILFTEKLLDNECLVVTGFQRYCDTSGYSYSFKFAGDHVDGALVDHKTGMRMSRIVAIDARPFNRNPGEQYSEKNVLRELNKAYIGFKNEYGRVLKELFLEQGKDEGPNPAAVATGNWGCGAFGGDPHLKSLLQLMAAAANGREVAYFAVGSAELAEEIGKMFELIKSKRVTVSQLYHMILGYRPGGFKPFRDYILQTLKSEVANAPQDPPSHRPSGEYGGGGSGGVGGGGADAMEVDDQQAKSPAASGNVTKLRRGHSTNSTL